MKKSKIMKINIGLILGIITLVSQIISTIIYYAKERNNFFSSYKKLWKQFTKSDFLINNNFPPKKNYKNENIIEYNNKTYIIFHYI